MFDFYMPANMIGGDGCVLKNAGIFRSLGARALLVTGKHAAQRSGALDDVTAALGQAGVAWKQYDGIGENPLLSSVEAAGNAAREFGADFIVGIGGGSALDGARAVCVYAKNSFNEAADIYRGFSLDPLPLVCIGTTAGTGSEADNISVLTNDATGEKKSVASAYARYVFCDPRYTCSMSRRQTVSTALDAFCHCLESWFSTAATELNDAAAPRGIELIFPWLERLARGEFVPDDRAMRQALYYGSLWGGFSINRVGTGFPHPMGYLLTERGGIPHGVACAVFERAFLEQSMPACPEKRDRLLNITGGEAALFDALEKLTQNDITLSASLCKEIEARLRNASNTRRTLGEFTSARGREIAERLFLDARQSENIRGGWLF
ncbi:MAG: iron-containing alcohol dehydrogenase [Oscillospiraceae bacterium]|nr:iron-containing alcohol dehydrogenase [Oscillospiraceae bacterium]